jgi:hypothetical protein
MRKVNISSRRRIAKAIRMVLRAEADEQDGPEAEDLVVLLDQWETGTIHGRDPVSFMHAEEGRNTDTDIDTVYG